MKKPLSKQDKIRTKNIIQYDTTRNVEKIFTIKDEYYKLISSTLQNSCHNLKRIAGRWSNSCGFFDGEKLGRDWCKSNGTHVWLNYDNISDNYAD